MLVFWDMLYYLYLYALYISIFSAKTSDDKTKCLYL